MQARFYREVRFPQLFLAPNKAARSGWLLAAVLTLLTLFWLFYRAVVQPAWIGRLPDPAYELLRLVETANAITLALLWAVLGWRRWQRQRSTPLPPVVSVNDLYALSPGAFERYVGGLFRRKGYKVKLRGRSGDLGVDLEITRRDGRRAIVQCKRYRHTVGAEIVRELFGTLIHERVSHGFLVTTADISDAAREWAANKPLTLIDGDLLVQIATALAAEEADR